MSIKYEIWELSNGLAVSFLAFRENKNKYVSYFIYKKKKKEKKMCYSSGNYENIFASIIS